MQVLSVLRANTSQQIIDGYQVEIPDYWLDNYNPWEFPRHDVTVDIQFFGHVAKSQDAAGKTVARWEGGEIVTAIAYDVPIPGYATPSTNNLRLWSSKAASGEFDFQKFNSGEVLCNCQVLVSYQANLPIVRKLCCRPATRRNHQRRAVSK